MVLQDLLAGGVEYVQDSQPSDADAGEIWLDTSVDPSALKIYDASSDVWDEAQASNINAPVSNIQDELQEGRTRELLLQLQDKPVPEVVNPINVQSTTLSTDENGDYILLTPEMIDDFESGDLTVENSGWSDWSGTTGSFGAQQNTVLVGSYSGELNSVNSGPSVSTETGGAPDGPFIMDVQIDNQTGNTGDEITIELGAFGNHYFSLVFDGGGNIIGRQGRNASDSGSEDLFSSGWSANVHLNILFDIDFSNEAVSVIIRNVDTGNKVAEKSGMTYGGARVQSFKYVNDTSASGSTVNFYLDDLQIGEGGSGFVTDRFEAPTTAPADFKQWNAIQAQDVTTGGSTSTNPVEFEILDSTDTVLNSARIPKSQIADEPFTMRNRVYSETAGSDGQSDYQIPISGEGGHFGIPILTVVSVKKNGAVLDSANWSFDGDTAVTIDTSNATIASGDTIDIKYDFDVFDSTLQPRAYLFREDTSETSPSISHFRYEYVI